MRPEPTIEEIEAALEAATPGPWATGGSWHYIDGFGVPCVYPTAYPEREVTIAMAGESLEPEQAQANVHLIANAPTYLAFLLARASELESALRELLDYPFPYGMYEEWRREGTVRSAEAMDAHSRRVAAARALLAPTQSGSTHPPRPTPRRRRVSARLHRMVLRRFDGLTYLSRWGIAAERLGGIYLHRMDAPDPGLDLHDHPWSFVSLILWGGYTEERARTREAPILAAIAERYPDTCTRGVVERRRWLSVRALRLDECHRVTGLHDGPVWTLVLRGPRRRRWGFYLPSGWMHEHEYDDTVRADRRDLWNELGT